MNTLGENDDVAVCVLGSHAYHITSTTSQPGYQSVVIY